MRNDEFTIIIEWSNGADYLKIVPALNLIIFQSNFDSILFMALRR